MTAFKVGIDAHSLAPLGLSPFETLDWALMNEADGVQFSEGAGPDPDRSFLMELAQYAEENRLYLEWGGGAAVPLDPEGRARDTAAVNRAAAEQARALGVDTIQASCSGPGRWPPGPPRTDELLDRTVRSLVGQLPTLGDLGVTLALETGAAFTTFELLRLFEACGVRPGGPLGISLDTLDVLTLLEAPWAAAERVLPWITTTRIKDGAVLLSEDGFAVYAAEAGAGVIGLEAAIALLGARERRIRLTLADRAGSVRVPAFEPGFAAGLPDLRAAELIDVLGLAMRSQRSLDEGRLVLLEPDRWPEHGERRLKRGLRALKRSSSS